MHVFQSTRGLHVAKRDPAGLICSSVKTVARNGHDGCAFNSKVGAVKPRPPRPLTPKVSLAGMAGITLTKMGNGSTSGGAGRGARGDGAQIADSHLDAFVGMY